MSSILQNFLNSKNNYINNIKFDEVVYKNTVKEEESFSPDDNWIETLKDVTVLDSYFSKRKIIDRSSFFNYKVKELFGNSIKDLRMFKSLVDVMLSVFISTKDENDFSNFFNEMFYSFINLVEDKMTPEFIMDKMCKNTKDLDIPNITSLRVSYQQLINKFLQLHGIQLTPSSQTFNMDISTFIREKRTILPTIGDFNNLQGVIGLIALLHLPKARLILEYSILGFIMVMVKPNCLTAEFWNRRSAVFYGASGIKESDIPKFDSIDFESASGAWPIVAHSFKIFKATPKGLFTKLTKTCESCVNPSITPMLTRGIHRNMTAITLISTAMEDYSDFPWAGLVMQNPAVKSEIVNYKTILKEICHDVYAGYKYTGASRAVPVLSYISIQLMMRLGGQNSLKFYRGVGGSDTTIPNQIKWDALISDYMNDKQSGFDYNALQEENKKSMHVLRSLGLLELITTYQSGVDQEMRSRKRKRDDSDQDETDDNPSDGSSSSDSDDNNDDDNYQPGQRKSKKEPKKKKQTDEKTGDSSKDQVQQPPVTGSLPGFSGTKKKDVSKIQRDSEIYQKIKSLEGYKTQPTAYNGIINDLKDQGLTMKQIYRELKNEVQIIKHLSKYYKDNPDIQPMDQNQPDDLTTTQPDLSDGSTGSDILLLPSPDGSTPQKESTVIETDAITDTGVMVKIQMAYPETVSTGSYPKSELDKIIEKRTLKKLSTQYYLIDYSVINTNVKIVMRGLYIPDLQKPIILSRGYALRAKYSFKDLFDVIIDLTTNKDLKVKLVNQAPHIAENTKFFILTDIEEPVLLLQS